MEHPTFLYCEDCKKIAAVIEGSPTLACCGDPMKALRANAERMRSNLKFKTPTPKSMSPSSKSRETPLKSASATCRTR